MKWIESSSSFHEQRSQGNNGKIKAKTAFHKNLYKFTNKLFSYEKGP